MTFPDQKPKPDLVLYWSPRSPFARKVTIVAHEAGVIDRIELRPIVVLSTQPNDALMALNPLGQIPTLVTPDGSAIYDSSAICHHLDVEHGAGRLHPGAPAARTRMLRLQALGDGLATLLLAWITERSRQQPDQSAIRIAAIAKKLPSIYGAIDREAEEMAAEPLHVGHAAIAAALGYADFRLSGDWIWRQRYPRLAAWQAGMAERPSLLKTAHYDELAAQASTVAAEEPTKGKP